MNSMTHMMKAHIRGFFAVIFVAATWVLPAYPVSAIFSDVSEIRDRAIGVKEDVERRTQMEERKAEVAEKREEKKQEVQAAYQERFCSNFIEGMDERKNRIAERYRETMDKRSDRLDTREDRRNDRDAKLDENRAEQDAKRAQWYDRLLAEADTDAERSAVAEFKATMEKAVADRRSATDAAIGTFRSEVDKLVTGKKTGTDTAMTAFKAAYDKAVTDAKNACEGDSPDPKAIRGAFMDAMKDARADFHEARSAIVGIGEQVKALAATKNAAIKSAMETFRETAEQARLTLRTALGDTNE